MDRNEILNLVGGNSVLKRDQVIDVDESQFSMSSRRWSNTDQQDFMDFLAAARFYGYIINIVALHSDMLDKIARQRIINYTIEMKDRGRGVIYERYRHPFESDLYPRRKGQLIQQLPDYDRCKYPTCLTCKHREDCQTIRAIYERKKRRFLVELARDKQTRAEIAKSENIVMKDKDIVDALLENEHRIPDTQKGFPDQVTIQIFIEEEYGLRIKGRRLDTIRRRYMLRNPKYQEKTQ